MGLDFRDKISLKCAVIQFLNSSNSSSLLLQWGYRHSYPNSQGPLSHEMMVQLLFGTYTYAIPQLSPLESLHLHNARPVDMYDHLHTAQIFAVNDVMNFPNMYGAFEGGPGTGKTHAIAVALKARQYGLCVPDVHGKRISLVLTETNRSAYNAAAALYFQDHVRFRYSCTEQQYSITCRSAAGSLLKKMNKEGFILDN